MYLTYTLGVNFSRIMGFLTLVSNICVTIVGNKEEWKSILTLVLSFGKFALNTCVLFLLFFSSPKLICLWIVWILWNQWFPTSMQGL